MYSVIASDGNTYGPVDISTLKQWCVEGRVSPGTNIIDGVSGRTMRASDLQDLYEIFPSAPPSPPPTPTYQMPSPATTQGYQPPGQAPTMGPPNQSYGGGGMYGQPYNQSQGSPYLRTTLYAGSAIGSKSKVAAALFAFFLGGLGVHRFYLGHTTTGVIMLVLWLSGFLLFVPFLVVGVWALVDFILILTGTLKDAQGYDLA